MTEILDKIICPFHKEKTASLVVYSDGYYYCFGCDKTGPSQELGNYEIRKTTKQEPENLEEKISYIKSLQSTVIRGIILPHDDDSYYILYPDSDYYLRRLKNPKKDQPKYIGAKGVTRPPLIFKRNSKTLLVVEGELNALSVAETCKDIDVLTLGSAGSYKENKLIPLLTYFKQFDTIVSVFDEDAAGAFGSLRLLDFSNQHELNIVPHLWKSDANDVLVEHGRNGLRQLCMEAIDGARPLSSRVSSGGQPLQTSRSNTS